MFHLSVAHNKAARFGGDLPVPGPVLVVVLVRAVASSLTP